MCIQLRQRLGITSGLLFVWNATVTVTLFSLYNIYEILFWHIFTNHFLTRGLTLGLKE